MDISNQTSAVHQGGHRPKDPIPSQRRATRILKGTASYQDRFFADHQELIEVLADLRSHGCVIIFTTGVWDLYHIGHADYIQKGKEEAVKLYPDAEHVIMVAGVDTDALTKKRKGEQRPIVPEDERCRILAHHRAVDIITLQYEFDQLYGVVSPHAQVVSTTTKDLPPGMNEAQRHCERLISLQPQAETSTSARVRRLAFDGSLETLSRVSAKLMTALEEARNELAP